MNKVRALMAAMAVLSLTGCATAPRPDGGTVSQVWSSSAALTFAIRQVCLPSQASGRPASDFAVRPSALPVSGRRAPSTPGQAWYVGSGVYVVEQPDRRGCHIMAGRGDAAAFRALAAGLLSSEPHRFVQGRSGLAGGRRMLRTTYCSTAPTPLMALMSTARPDSGNTPALQLTIFPSDASSARTCASNGPGDGSDRDFDEG